MPQISTVDFTPVDPIDTTFNPDARPCNASSVHTGF